MLVSLASGGLMRVEVVSLLLVVSGLAVLMPKVQGNTPAASRPDDRHLIVLSLALITPPVAVWVVSLLVRPLFVDRFFIPSVLGWTILVARASARLLQIPNTSRNPQGLSHNLMLGAAALGLLAFPLHYAIIYPPEFHPGAMTVYSIPEIYPL